MSTNWRNLTDPALRGLNLQTSDPNNQGVLFLWGPRIEFRVWPMNIHEYDHESDTDWAQKEIAGAAIYREWVGENDEVLYLRGRLFPYRIGGVPQIEVLGNRRAGLAQLLMRGANPTTKLGWFVCEKLVRANTFLSGEGLGQQINFEAQMARVPTPQDPDGLLFAQNAAVGNI